jgi:hypothetical protein
MPVSKKYANCEQSHILYRKTLKKLCKAIQNKGHGKLTSRAVLLHDSMRPHTAAFTRAPLEHFNWELFDHPTYSPDLAPSDYHLFMYLKKWLRSQCFNNNNEMIGRCQNVAKLTGH